MKNNIYFFIVILIVLSSCKSQQYIHFVAYSQHKFEKTQVEDIKVYQKRLDLPSKYFEIGVLKVEGEHTKAELLKEASEKGADAIIYEANNVVLIHFIKTEKDEEPEDIY